MKRILYIILIFNTKFLLAQDTIPDLILEGHKYSVFCINFSNDNKYLVSGSWDNKVKVWDYMSQKEIKSFSYHKDMILDVCFSNDNSMIASASRDNTIKVINLLTGEIRIFIPNQYLKPNTKSYYGEIYFNSILFTPDDKYLMFTLVGSDDINIWDIKANRLSDRINGNGFGIGEIKISNSGKYIAGTTGDKSIIIWDVETKKEVMVLKGNVGSVGTVCFSPDDKYLISGGGSNVVGRNLIDHYVLKTWDLTNRVEINELSGHIDVVREVRYLPNGRHIVSASEDNSVRIWDVHLAKQIWKFENDCYFWSCAISSDGKYLAACSRDATIKIWNLERILKENNQIK